MFPLFESIPFHDPCDYFQGVSEQPFAMFLDSSRQDEELGRYSYIAFDPFLTLVSKNGKMRVGDFVSDADPFTTLAEVLKQYPLSLHQAGPPFQGGVLGYFGYDLAHHIETLPKAKRDDMAFHDLALGCYDVVLGFDLVEEKAWIFSSGYPETEPNARLLRAQSRMRDCLSWLQLQNDRTFMPSRAVISRDQIQSLFTKETYCEAVSQFIEYILAGDIFEGTMSQRLIAPMPDMTPFELYERLRRFNPAPFSAYLNFPDQVIASASPERFLKLHQGLVETRPIKGTVRRSLDPTEDAKLAADLEDSEKDKAENVMIVDLMRNDLSRVCKDGSVQVPKLCGLESFATVHHLVSVVTGTLAAKQDAIDLLRATFPGGSVTGAPKIRAMEIIAELEPTARGPYCGSVGYVGFNGDMDTSIVIRTFAIKNQNVTFQVGGAIVADSDPEGEYEESLVKAAAMIRSLVEY
jgi:para-aminobenzoate synthetase component I